MTNVKIYKGWFKDTLSLFKKQILHDKPIAFLNIDSDIYSAAREPFDILGDYIVPGTVIYFDEIYNYCNFEQGEWRVFQEFLSKSKFEFEDLTFNKVNKQAVIQIESK